MKGGCASEPNRRPCTPGALEKGIEVPKGIVALDPWHHESVDTPDQAVFAPLHVQGGIATDQIASAETLLPSPPSGNRSEHRGVYLGNSVPGTLVFPPLDLPASTGTKLRPSSSVLQSFGCGKVHAIGAKTSIKLGRWAVSRKPAMLGEEGVGEPLERQPTAVRHSHSCRCSPAQFTCRMELRTTSPRD